MKNYKNYKKVYIGESDIASLTLRAPTKAHILKFGSDGCYEAYIVDGKAEIGNHYKLDFTCNHWLKIYDDFELVKTFKADEIKVYTVGSFGCIIQLINQKEENNVKD